MTCAEIGSIVLGNFQLLSLNFTPLSVAESTDFLQYAIQNAHFGIKTSANKYNDRRTIALDAHSEYSGLLRIFC